MRSRIGILKVWMKCEVAPIFFVRYGVAGALNGSHVCVKVMAVCRHPSLSLFFFPLAIYLDVDAQQQNE